MKLILTIIITVLTVTSCVKEDEYGNTPSQNLEALWSIMDQKYCFFNEKKEQLGVDWNEVHGRYLKQVNDKLSRTQLFELMTGMIGELRDGHVNLTAAFDYGRNWAWHEDYPANFSDTLQRRYIGTDYKIAAGLRYCILDDNTGYLYCPTFENDFGIGNLDEIMLYLAPCNKLIVDVRNNGGGMLVAAQNLAARFTNEEILAGYMRHKTGKGHNDFSAMEEQVLKPGKGIRWQKDVVVLTNRSVYSAANEFVKYMKEIGRSSNNKTVTIIGDTTGGGAGMPFSSELPNGWGVRFSACPMFDACGNSTESGIEPDIHVDISSADYQKGVDTIIERARKH